MRAAPLSLHRYVPEGVPPEAARRLLLGLARLAAGGRGRAVGFTARQLLRAAGMEANGRTRRWAHLLLRRLAEKKVVRVVRPPSKHRPARYALLLRTPFARRLLLLLRAAEA